MSTADEKREIKRLNKVMEKKGAKSRYIDSNMEGDFGYNDDTQLADREMPSMDDIPKPLQDIADRARARVAAEMERRGMTGMKDPVSKTLTRPQVVARIIEYNRNVIGYDDEEYMDEYIELLGARHPLDTRPLSLE